LLLSSLPHQKARRPPTSNHEANILKVLGRRKIVAARWVDHGNRGRIPINPNARRDPPSQETLPLSLTGQQDDQSTKDGGQCPKSNYSGKQSNSKGLED
jgi:hypothetical protein